ncbi:hypothetical protein IG389_07910 [Idiomarina abyssalis]|uniref:Uncharacterized protein n=1 Tax=Idiomarina abyssalis TaxID=86102 RepID=A0A8I1G8M7_9GAMM|nr:hypothetical protein [Idiomarina abyssalis]MAL84304.1 hypothetical protein [Idiomarina sp.]MBJ7265658.1 hypothetical protein [Idiomarina abyssalis]MBJ7273842.1 hypothetical protein [Idiomarina abyssalis]MBJ7314452.1 hypothetical protein [Idiomarina abyssalis]
MVEVTRNVTKQIYCSKITFDNIVEFISRISEKESEAHKASILIELHDGTKFRFQSASEATSSEELNKVKNKRLVGFSLNFYPEFSVWIYHKRPSHINYESGETLAVALLQLAEDCLQVKLHLPGLIKILDNYWIIIFTLFLPSFLLVKQMDTDLSNFWTLFSIIIVLNFALPSLVLKYKFGTTIVMENNKDSFWYRHKESIFVSLIVGALFFSAGLMF